MESGHRDPTLKASYQNLRVYWHEMTLEMQRLEDKMIQRPRILRQSHAIRSMVRETILTPNDLIAPLFTVEGEGIEEEIPSLSGYSRRSLDKTVKRWSYCGVWASNPFFFLLNAKR